MTTATTPQRAKTRLDSLTSLRFFAAAFVVVHHTAGPDNTPIVDLGFLGVTFFFVLSGFVLTWAGSADRGALTSYRNRFARIYPLQLVTLLVALVLPLRLDGDSPVTFVQNLTATQAWTDAGAHSFNWVSWSISCEAFFYLLFPAAIWLLRRASSRLVALVLVAAWFVQGVVGYGLAVKSGFGWAYFATYDFPPFRFAEFFVGVCLALLMTRGWRPTALVRWATVAVAVLGLLAVLRWDLGGGQARPVLSSATVPAVVVLLWWCVQRESAGRARLLTWPVLRVLGEWSFALYMVHMLVLRGVAVLAGRDTAAEVGYFPVWSVVPILVLCVAVAAAAHRLVERPMERRLRAPRSGDRTAVAGTHESAPPTPEGQTGRSSGADVSSSRPSRGSSTSRPQHSRGPGRHR